MQKSLGRPPPHLEGTLRVDSCINGKLNRRNWKERYLVVLKNDLIIYEKGSRHHSSRKVWKKIDLTEDHEQYKFWFDSLLYVKDFWIDRMTTIDAPAGVATPERGQFEALVTDITGCKRTIRMKKDAIFKDFYDVWKAKDDGTSITRKPVVNKSFRTLQEKGVQLWGLHKTEGEYLINKSEEIFPYVAKDYKLFLLEKCYKIEMERTLGHLVPTVYGTYYLTYLHQGTMKFIYYKLIVIYFDDDDVVAAPVPPNITTSQVAELPSVKDKLNEKDSSASYILVKRIIRTGVDRSGLPRVYCNDISLKDNEKPLDIFYESGNGVALRKLGIKAKLVYLKETEANLVRDKTTISLPSGVIPTDAPDLPNVYISPSQRGKSPIKGMFQELVKSSGNEMTKTSNKNLKNVVSDYETDPCDGLNVDAEDISTKITVSTVLPISNPHLPPKKRIGHIIRSRATTEALLSPSIGAAVGADMEVKVNAGCDVDSTTLNGLVSDSSSSRAGGQRIMDNVVMSRNEKSHFIGETCHNESAMPEDESSLSCSGEVVDSESPADHTMKSHAAVLSQGKEEASNGGAVISGKISHNIFLEDDAVPDDVTKHESIAYDGMNLEALDKVSTGLTGLDIKGQLRREAHGNSVISGNSCNLQSGHMIEDSLIERIASEQVNEHNDGFQVTNTQHNINENQDTTTQHNINDNQATTTQHNINDNQPTTTQHNINENQPTTTQQYSKLVETSGAPSWLVPADPQATQLNGLNRQQNLKKAMRVVDVQVHCPPDQLPRNTQIPIVGGSVGAILPSIAQGSHAKASSPIGQTAPIQVNSQNNTNILPTSVNSSQVSVVVNSGVGMILPSRTTSLAGSSPYSGSENCTDDVDSKEDDDESCVSSIESFMESFDSAKSERENIEAGLRCDAATCNSSTSLDGNEFQSTNVNNEPRIKEGSHQDVLRVSHNSSAQESSASSATAETVTMSNFVTNHSIDPQQATDSVYEAGKVRQDSLHHRRDAFKRNEYEKDVTMERIRRHKFEREQRLEEEARKKQEEEARQEKIRQREAAQEKARQTEADQEEVMQRAAGQEVVKVTAVNSDRVAESAVASDLSGFNKRPASPMRRRVPCATCDLCDIKPFQVLKLKEMNMARQECTQTADTNSSSVYNYLCLSGVHIENINGTWKLVDDTVFHNEAEFTSSLESLKAPAIKTDDNLIASKVKRERRFKLNGGICCHWIPTNGGKWRVTGFAEDHLESSLKPEDERLRPIPSPCFGASETEVRGKEVSKSGVAKEQHGSSKIKAMKNTISDKMESTARVVGSTVKEVFVQNKPTHEMYVSLETLEFRDRYIMPLGRVVIAIGQHFLDAQSCRVPRQAGDDSICSELGWLIRRDFCTAFFSLILHDVKRDKSVTRFLTGRSSKFSLWSLITDVTQACVEVPVLQEIIFVIQKSPFLFDDDLRARNFVCEALNWHNETWNEALLITWFKHFTRMKHLIDKYFEKSSIWKRPDREVAGIVNETLHILEHLNPYHFNLHADFEHKELAKRASQQSLALILQREPSHVDMDAMTFE